MSANFGHHPWTVQELVSGIDKGSVRLPDIQRPFVWPNAKVRDLIDSMYRGYPVGELMFWANKDADHAKVIGDGAAKTQEPSMQVIDGQQRLTSPEPIKQRRTRRRLSRAAEMSSPTHGRCQRMALDGPREMRRLSARRPSRRVLPSRICPSR